MHQTLRTPATVEVNVHWAGLRQLTDVSVPEWRMVCARHCNMLLEGRGDATDAALDLVRPHLLEAVHWKQRTAPLQLPSRRIRTLVLENVASLQAIEQTDLLTWLAAADERIQIVSTATHPLFPSVVCGAFDERLYYRLNTVRLRID